MIPENLRKFLEINLPEQTIENRLIKEGCKRYIEFNILDVERLSRLGITADNLGPRLVSCMWDEESSLEIGGYLVVDNLAMGKPSMGGIRMLPEVTPSMIHNLARGMTLKNAAAKLPYGGGKSGIISNPHFDQDEHYEIVRRFARLLSRYTDIYLPGPDVGTNDQDMRLVAIENGLDNALSKPIDMGGNRIDELGAAAGGTIIALEALLEEMPRLRCLPQFSNFQLPDENELTVLIQGFGAVGAHAARILKERIKEAKIVGVSDLTGYLYNINGLPVEKLFNLWEEFNLVTRRYFESELANESVYPPITKYSNSSDDLLREKAFCLIPATPIPNYLDIDDKTKPCITTNLMGNWQVIVEGANTYSPDPIRKAARERMERVVYREKGVLIATDYLVNSGGVIFAAQEHLIKTPEHIRIPKYLFGDDKGVQNWLDQNNKEFEELAKIRLNAAQQYREEVIRRNMRELIDLLITDADMLPCEAAEAISIRRITATESDRTAAELLEPMPIIAVETTAQQAASLMIEASSSIVAVISKNGVLEGVVTEWDITRSTALGSPDDIPLEKIITRNVISAKPDDSLMEIIRKLEYHEISALPVVENGEVLGMISADSLARKSLLRLLQSQL